MALLAMKLSGNKVAFAKCYFSWSKKKFELHCNKIRASLCKIAIKRFWLVHKRHFHHSAPRSSCGNVSCLGGYPSPGWGWYPSPGPYLRVPTPEGTPWKGSWDQRLGLCRILFQGPPSSVPLLLWCV